MTLSGQESNKRQLPMYKWFNKLKFMEIMTNYHGRICVDIIAPYKYVGNKIIINIMFKMLFQ